LPHGVFKSSSFVCVDIIFCGNALGNSYENVTPHVALPSFPPCSNIKESVKSVHKIVETKAKVAGISHFCLVYDVQKYSSQFYLYSKRILEFMKYDNAKDLLFQHYQKIFGSNFQEKSQRVGAHCRWNQAGIESWFEKSRLTTFK
jgi:hypothetical protein